MVGQKYRRPDDAATFLRDTYGQGSIKTLAKLRCIGGGPKFRKFGRHVLYADEDLVAWAEERLSALRCSTSDETAA